MVAPPTPEEIHDVNTRYHDVAAADYDAKWGIDFGAIGRRQVRGKVAKLLGPWPGPFQRSLEIGAGTGYFTLNLMQDGTIAEATCTDISPGMLATLAGNAERLGLDVRTVVATAEELPFANEAFDLVLGHAVLHHIPDLEQAFAEIARVLRPGGTFLFAGEPSHNGDRLAAVPKRGALAIAPLWRKLLRAAPAPEHTHRHGHEHAHGSIEHELESTVDVHAFTPAELRGFAERAGFDGVTVRGEEMVANWFGWFNRTIEATARPEDVPYRWRQYAYHGYVQLQRVDAALLEPRLPAGWFYNLMICGRKPER
ncbi:MAG TPA: class I SAM-dependent methyltransferase [Solirubrobacteraceae bacterium]|nr:class I SAM-dependent methyltransferase [Solirubrobacteraceae bacterium]